MQFKTHQILWHDKQPILSCDAHGCRLATAGADNNVRLWSIPSSFPFDPAYISTLSRHTASVNCTRWSSDGKKLASASDDGNIIIWQQSSTPCTSLEQPSSDQDVETWKAMSILRAGCELTDVAWSPDDSKILASSIDNTARVFCASTGKSLAILSKHSNYVQGVAWDPLDEFYVTQSSDPSIAIFNSRTNALVVRHDKVNGNRIYCPEGLVATFFRRPCWSPDGALLLAPCGLNKQDDSTTNCVNIYTRNCLKGAPAAILPRLSKPATVVKFSPLRYTIRQHPPPMIALGYRLIYAVATIDSILVYDTQQSTPIVVLQNLHYSNLTDLCWSGDLLIVSSSDGYCSVVDFGGELGDIYQDPVKMDVEMDLHQEHKDAKENIDNQLPISPEPVVAKGSLAIVDGKKRISFM